MKAWVAFSLPLAYMSACGAESTSTTIDPNFIDECEHEGWTSIPGTDDLRVSFSYCEKEKRYLLFFEQQKPGRVVPSVVDKLSLPSMKNRDDLKLWGECEDTTKPLLNNQENVFFVIAHRPKNKESVNWKTGVKAAWTVNRHTLRFEDYPIRHIVCYKPTPP